MKNRYVKMTACMMAAVLSFTGMGMNVHASDNVASVLPSSGIDFSLQSEDKSTSLSSLQEESEKAAALSEAEGGMSVGSVQVGSFAEIASTEDKVSAAPAKKIEDTIVFSKGYTEDLKKAANTGLSEEEESFKDLVIAKVNDYVNVRDIPSEEGNIVGKLYNKSVGNFVEEEDGWYKINSGSVEGYVKAEFVSIQQN